MFPTGKSEEGYTQRFSPPSKCKTEGKGEPPRRLPEGGNYKESWDERRDKTQRSLSIPSKTTMKKEKWNQDWDLPELSLHHFEQCFPGSVEEGKE
nr:hypothetical protein [Tanacetum cinerariifolium]